MYISKKHNKNFNVNMRFQILPYSKGSHNELNYVPLNLYIEALTPSVIALVFEDGNLEVSRLR